jgi:hypothetical protein
MHSLCNDEVQQNLYGALLLMKYGLKLSSMWLCQLHVDLPSYSFIEAPLATRIIPLLIIMESSM